MEEVLTDATTTEQSDAIVDAPFELALNHFGPRALPLAAAMTRAAHLPEWRLGSVPFPAYVQTLLPADATVVLNVKDGCHVHTTPEGPGFVLYLCAGRTETSISVAARTGERAERIEAIKGRIAQPPSHTVPFTLWRCARGEASSWHRDLDVPTWADIPLQQLWLDHLLTLRLRQSPDDPYVDGAFVLLYPAGNANCVSAAETYAEA